MLWKVVPILVEHFCGKYPELEKMVEDLSDEEIENLRFGGHDPAKVYMQHILKPRIKRNSQRLF